MLKKGWIFFCVLLACNFASEPTILSTNPDFKTDKNVAVFQGNPFTGYVITQGSGGDTVLFVHYKRGKPDGPYKRWYDNGTLRETGNYRNGSKNGIQKGFWLDGKPRFIFNFTLDSLHGNQKEWNDRGTLIWDGNYRMGKETGWQRKWTDKGKLKINYQVINGRKYGLQESAYCDTLIKQK